MVAPNDSLHKEASHLWQQALKLLEHYQQHPGKTDVLLESLPDRFRGVQRRRCQMLFMQAVRHALWIETLLKAHLRKVPRPRLKALLHLAVGELHLREAPRRAAVVDFAVEQAKGLCSRGEVAMVNAVLRKIVADLDAPVERKLPLHIRYSHPKWLVEKWRAEHGLEVTRAWLEWDQRPPELFVRLLGEVKGEQPEGFEETPWPGFVSVGGAQWPQVEALLNAGLAYVQDPSTRIAVGLLAPRPGEVVLDLCAAPGGKSISIARAVGANGKLVAVDLPGRVGRLRDNLARTGGNCEVVECDALQFKARAGAMGSPEVYDAVLLDAPCSNTGVLRRRPDAKWRLKPKDISAMPQTQGVLLREAAGFVKPGGRLVYSTCSVEREENAAVVEAFLKEVKGFALEEQRVYYPHEAAHDGGGAFRLRREA